LVFLLEVQMQVMLVQGRRIVGAAQLPTEQPVVVVLKINLKNVEAALG
jgi:hypothetical protein